ncbi:MAG: hypothetical protein ABJI69_16160 [Balneola sp.]
MKFNQLKRLRNIFHTPNKQATLLFGLNKSGTTVTINLIAARAGLTFTDDFPYHLGDFDKVLNKQVTLEDYVNLHSYEFSKDLIRFPDQPEAVDMARKYFDKKKYLLTVRNPVDNIRSILGRLKIPGDLNFLDLNTLELHPNWIKMLGQKEHYIESIATCWFNTYNSFYPFDSECILFKYEDFLSNKIDYIDLKVNELGFERVNSIQDIINVQYQPKGPSVNSTDFFSKKNLERIYTITGDLMTKYGYSV